MSLYEWIAVAVSILAIVLTGMRLVWCWPVGLASVLLYGKLFFDERLYSDGLLQIVFGMLQLYGWWGWIHSKKGVHDRRVVVLTLPRTQLVCGVAGAIGAGLLFGLGMHHLTDAAYPYLDAVLAGLSLVAQWWQARRYSENWLLWIAVDMVYVGLYIAKGLYPTALLYGVLVIIAAVSWRAWRSHTYTSQPV